MTPKRKWYQLRLLTCIVMMLVGAVFVGLNLLVHKEVKVWMPMDYQGRKVDLSKTSFPFELKASYGYPCKIAFCEHEGSTTGENWNANAETFAFASNPLVSAEFPRVMEEINAWGAKLCLNADRALPANCVTAFFPLRPDRP